MPAKTEDFEYGLRLLAKLIAAKLRADTTPTDLATAPN
jgi:hypothetical protein